MSRPAYGCRSTTAGRSRAWSDAGDRVDRFLVVGGHDLDARALECAARHQEAGIGLRHLEGRRRQRALSRAAARRRCSPSRCRSGRGRRWLLSAPPSGRPSPWTTWNASPVAVQLSSVPDSKSRFERPAVGLGRRARRDGRRRVGDLEASLHAGGAMPGQRAEVGIAALRLERDAGGRALVEDLRALHVAAFRARCRAPSARR